jgi:ubiquinone/menaquinone biosynthesis C-methylase UbiE
MSDAQALPFDGGAFDVVVAHHMLYHVPNLDAALSEFVRVLRPGGKLFAATNGRKHFKEVREILDIHWRYVDAFGLENGPDTIARYFDDVIVERYEDAIETPESAPVIAYVRSMSTFWTLGEDRAVELQRQIDAVIEREGVFRISKDAGVIVARRR